MHVSSPLPRVHQKLSMAVNILCLGCGEDITARTADRRAPAAEHVVEAWKAVFENVTAVQVESEDGDVD